jgi:hypothetical protein
VGAFLPSINYLSKQSSTYNVVLKQDYRTCEKNANYDGVIEVETVQNEVQYDIFTQAAASLGYKSAKEMNIPKRQLITNGYFSKDSGKIRAVAFSLAESGVNEILLSVDAFHQETIPLEYVKAFAKAVKEAGVNIKVHPAWLVRANAENIYNNKTKEILKSFNDMGIEENEGNIIWPSGNAVKYLSEYFDLSQSQKSPYEENPKDIRAICFSANGDILKSNIYKKDILKILDEYKA